MPSFKTVITALAVAAFAVGVNAENHPSSLEQRSVARAAAARRAIARREAMAAPGEFVSAAAALADTTQSIAAGMVPCITTSDCNNVDLFPGSRAVCISGGCRIRCRTGYIPIGGTPPSQCIEDAETCTRVQSPHTTITCPIVIDGWTTCNAHGTKCNKKCLKAWRLHNNGDNTYQCVDVYHDAANCGAYGNACPGDYNNLVGSAPRCISKKCTLYCPTGTTATPTGNSERPLACA